MENLCPCEFTELTSLAQGQLGFYGHFVVFILKYNLNLIEKNLKMCPKNDMKMTSLNLTFLNFSVPLSKIM